MSYILQLGVILGVSLAGEALRALLPLPVPASVYGLCLMLALLCTGVLKADRIRPTANFLIEIMPIMFVPSTVGLMQSWGVLSPVLIPFFAVGFAVMLMVMIASGHAAQGVIRLERRMRRD